MIPTVLEHLVSLCFLDSHVTESGTTYWTKERNKANNYICFTLFLVRINNHSKLVIKDANFIYPLEYHAFLQQMRHETDNTGITTTDRNRVTSDVLGKTPTREERMLC